MKKKIGRFIKNSFGSDMLRPLRRSRHLTAQMSFFGKRQIKSQSQFLGSSGGQIKFL